MVKIAMIGAGSAVFCLRLVRDILNFDSLKDAHIVLMDIDDFRLKITYRVLQRMAEQQSLKCTFSATTDRRKALTGADFAVCMIQVGGLEPHKLDISIPLKYGVEECIGDTLNPGGIFRGLRTVPVLMQILRDVEEVCPEVVFMNYSNPMAICSWAIEKVFPRVTSIGLCHGVQHTTNKLCRWLNVRPEECEVLTAGINHMAWFLEFRHKGKDLYSRMWRKLKREGPIRGEEYRFEMMKATGYFMTESSGHLSEYLPYFRKRKDLQKLFGGPGFSGETGAYLKMWQRGAGRYLREMAAMASGKKVLPDTDKKSVEYAAGIMNAKLTGKPIRIAGNVLNRGFIINLPDDCCVEVPVVVDASGFHPVRVGALPEQCAALCQSNIWVQTLAVKAALEGDYEAAYHACLLDPLTAAVLAPHEIRNLVDEMFAAQRRWLPQFRGRKNKSPGATIGRIKTGARQIKKGRKLKSGIGYADI